MTIYKIEGSVPEPAKVIVVNEADWSTYTNIDANGNFTIDNMPDGDNKLIIARNTNTGEAKAYSGIAPIAVPVVETSFPVITGTDDSFSKYTAFFNTYTYLTMYRNSSIFSVRIQNVDIPRGATIEYAYLRLIEYYQPGSITVALTERLYCEASDNAAAVSDYYNLNGRPKTSNYVSWAIPNFSSGGSGTVRDTPSLIGPISEVINRPGWQAGNSLHFIGNSSSSGDRSFASFENGTYAAPKLMVKFLT